MHNPPKGLLNFRELWYFFDSFTWNWQFFGQFHLKLKKKHDTFWQQSTKRPVSNKNWIHFLLLLSHSFTLNWRIKIAYFVAIFCPKLNFLGSCMKPWYWLKMLTCLFRPEKNGIDGTRPNDGWYKWKITRGWATGPNVFRSDLRPVTHPRVIFQLYHPSLRQSRQFHFFRAKQTL